jgi:hypothetical protein
MLRARGADPNDWMRLTTIETDTLDAWPRLVRQHRIVPEAQRLASSYLPPTWWLVRYVRTGGTPAERAEEWRVRLWPDGRPWDTRRFIPDSARRASADAATIRRIARAALARDGIDTTTLQETEYRERPRPARHDVRVTYTDTAIKLPAGAAARATVVIAGNEPLGVRRGVELPEAFLRADRAHQTNRMLVAGVSMVLLLTLLVGGAIVVKHRLPVAVHDGLLYGRIRLLLVGGLALLAILIDLNSLPSQLSSYDTAQPWSTFIGRTALGFVAPVFMALLLVGLLLVLDGLRRRVGVPMLAGEPARSERADMLIAGLGIAGVTYAMTDLDALISRGGMPPTPSTALDAAVPLLAGIPDIPASAVMAVAMIGIPILVVAGLAPRWSWRLLIATVLVALVAALVWSSTPTGEADPAGLGLAIATIVVMMGVIVVWGSRSAWSWIVAALSYQAFGALRDAVYGPEWQTRVAGALTVLVVLALLGLIAHHAPSRAAPVPAAIPPS